VIRTPANRDLAQPELRHFVRDLVTRTNLWKDLVHHDPEARTYEQLLRDQHVEVWLICWMDDHDTGFHDHDVSAGALAVAQGRVREERLGLGGSVVERTLEAGEAIDFAASDIHRVTHAGNTPAVTINAYSPPLWRMGAYEIRDSGELQRHSISYAEELRPVQASPARSLPSSPGSP
jgi:predicted metal-dependent enzyme (double-stranded beta helix superfamily)